MTVIRLHYPCKFSHSGCCLTVSQPPNHNQWPRDDNDDDDDCDDDGNDNYYDADMSQIYVKKLTIWGKILAKTHKNAKSGSLKLDLPQNMQFCL